MLGPLPPLETLNRKGWRMSPSPDGWCLRQAGNNRVVYLSQTPHWCCLASPLSLQTQGRDLAAQAHMYRQLLEENGHTFMIKNGLDACDRLCRLVEIPVQHSAYSYLFEWALDGLTHAELGTSALATGVGELSEGLPRETLLFYLKTISLQGWVVYKYIPERKIWYLHYYRHRFHKLDVYLRTTRTWTFFEMPVLEQGASPLRADPLVQKIFLEYLLRLNALFFLARISVTEDGQVLLLLEVPTEILDLALFQFITLTLENYAKNYFEEILIMASLQADSRLLQAFTQPVV